MLIGMSQYIRAGRERLTRKSVGVSLFVILLVGLVVAAVYYPVLAARAVHTVQAVPAPENTVMSIRSYGGPGSLGTTYFYEVQLKNGTEHAVGITYPSRLACGQQADNLSYVCQDLRQIDPRYHWRNDATKTRDVCCTVNVSGLFRASYSALSTYTFVEETHGSGGTFIPLENICLDRSAGNVTYYRC